MYRQMTGCLNNGSTQLVRHARQLFGFLNHKTVVNPSVSGSSNHIQMGPAAELLSKANGDSPGQAGMRVASKLIEDGGEFVRTPMKWIRHMQDNWLIYIVCAAIICLCLLFFYCLIRRYLTGQRTSSSGFTSQLVDLAVVMANHQQQQQQQRSPESLSVNKPIEAGDTRTKPPTTTTSDNSTNKF